MARRSNLDPSIVSTRKAAKRAVLHAYPWWTARVASRTHQDCARIGRAMERLRDNNMGYCPPLK